MHFVFLKLSENHDRNRNEGHNTQDRICTHSMNIYLQFHQEQGNNHSFYIMCSILPY